MLAFFVGCSGGYFEKLVPFGGLQRFKESSEMIEQHSPV